MADGKFKAKPSLGTVFQGIHESRAGTEKIELGIEDFGIRPYAGLH